MGDTYEFLKAQHDAMIQAKVEKVAEMVYEWIHDAQVAHKKLWVDLDEKTRSPYLLIAKQIVDFVL